MIGCNTMIKKLIPIIAVFMVDIFFVVANLIGYEYSGSGETSIYIFYNIFIFTVIMVFYAYKILSNTFFTSKKQLLILWIPFIVTMIFLVEILFGNLSNSGQRAYMFYVLWAMPAMITGVYLNSTNRYKEVIMNLELVMLFFSISSLKVFINSLSTGLIANMGGSTYQHAGYLAALAYGINLYFVFYGHKHVRYNFTNTTIYKWLSVLLIFIQVIGVAITGARGAMVFVIIYTLYVLVNVIKTTKQLTRVLLVITLAVVFTNLFWDNLYEIPIFRSAINRTFAYISPEGIYWGGTSGRDIVYSRAIDNIKESPLFGYGLFGYYRKMGYPHNIILEVLIQGGIIYFSFFIAFSLILFIKIRKHLKIDKELKLFAMLLLFSLVQLAFSGTYMHNSTLNFTIAFFMTCDYTE